MDPPLPHSTKPAKTSRYTHNAQATSSWCETALSLAQTAQYSAHFSQMHQSLRRTTTAQASASSGGLASCQRCETCKLAPTGITFRPRKRTSCLPACHHLPVRIPPTLSVQRRCGRKGGRRSQRPLLGIFWHCRLIQYRVVQVLQIGYDSRHSHTAASTIL